MSGENGLAVNFSESMRLLRRAAEGHHVAPAANGVGYLFEDGLGVAKDVDEACSWFHKAAASDNDMAKRNLRRIARNGKGNKVCIDALRALGLAVDQSLRLPAWADTDA